MRRLILISISLCALLVQMLALPLMAQSIIVSGDGGGAATSVTAAAFPLLAPPGTEVAPSYSFSSNTGHGMYFGSASSVLFSVAGTRRVNFTSTNLINIRSDGQFSFASGADILSTVDTGLARDAAGIIRPTQGGANNGSFYIGNTNNQGLFFGTNSSGNGDPALVWNTTQTPDALVMMTGTTANSWNMFERQDNGFDFNNGPAGTSAATNPQFIVHDKDQNTTNYQSLGVSGLSGRFVKTLTDATPTSVVIIPVAAATSVSGMMLYTVHARDATNTQTRSGRIIWSGVAEGTTATCVIGTAEELDNTPTGTLTAAITCTSPANNQIQLLINATSSLTETALEAYVQLQLVGAGEPLPQ